MKLSFDPKDAVQILLGLDELPQVVRKHLLGLICAIRKGTDSRVTIQIIVFDLLVRVVLIADGVRDLTGSWEVRCHLFIQVHLKFIFNSCRYQMRKDLLLAATETAYVRSSVLLLWNSGP